MALSRTIPRYPDVPREAGPVTTSNALDDLPAALRAAALRELRESGYRPVASNLWRVRRIPGGFEIDRATR
jgi:hypothetical protein